MSNAQLTLNSGTLQANGIKVSYHRTGGEKPPLVLAHGLTDMGLCWLRLASSLSHKYDVVMYDARGHGDSDAPANGHEPENRAEDLFGLVEGLKLESPRLLGHSLGAMTVALFASKYPGRARSVVLEDPPFPSQLDREPTAEQRKAWQKGWNDWRDAAVPRTGQSCAELQQICRRQSPLWHDLEISPWAEAKIKTSPHVFEISNLTEHNWWQCLPKLECPTLLLSAETKRGALMTTSAEGYLREFCPEVVTLVRLQGAGHNIHRDNFDRFISLVSDFFARN